MADSVLTYEAVAEEDMVYVERLLGHRVTILGQVSSRVGLPIHRPR
jgi:hypothetical protein